MSFTETQLIHRISHSSGAAAGFLIPTMDTEHDNGLVMKLDSKSGDSLSLRSKSTNATYSNLINSLRKPVSSQFCGQSNSVSLSKSSFQATSCVQAAQILLINFTNNVNQTIQKKVLPVLLYMSFLVMTIQSVAVALLLAQSPLPLGIYFLMTCITSLGGIYCFTAVVPAPHSSNSPKSPIR